MSQIINIYTSLRDSYIYPKGSYSKCTTIIQRVLQGTVLGTILFIFYINDLPSNVQIYFSNIYVDDTVFLISRESGEELRNVLENTLASKIYDICQTPLFYTQNLHLMTMLCKIVVCD